ncbi:nucleotidyl transferase AbiEii/AbiGii toxin family protein [Streptomyces sp. TLI_171]|uniref:nucleotidyl transferase AbiEii/AbiGii toxin family protein n=1 Tax=Streptomyces sp. TLI_171 TaxID=1938859 RepID=UPI000C195F19|nr:nucleotidyl transferase AbiEii/AbiGii toxin family protein [Streptomyces sp. TLI_171]RKE21166.1 nucleotidyltransferase AbiEii toxin of type IV toxin-antitoxin system [Streptomyces sp. TLI_171]
MTDARDLQRRAGGLPLTFRPIEDPRARQPAVFDPSLKQHGHAFRTGDPRFADPALAAAWRAARRTAMDAVLTAVADSGWVDHLVLRGSVVLRAWFGEAAREPGDLDFVVVPEDWAIDEARTADLLHGLTRAAAAATADGPVRILAHEAVSEEIWTYERVPGRRLLLPWEADGLPGGGVQLDFVFNEPLPVPPEPLEVAPGAVLNVATRELSLAWKLMWLHTDGHPQGKDLYDAALLAGSVHLRYAVLRDVFVPGEAHYAELPLGPESVPGAGEHRTEWFHFAGEYPESAGDEAAHHRRLAAALAPTFAEVPEAERAAWWSAGWVAPLRAAHAAGGPDAAESWLRDRNAPLGVAHRLLQRALGPDAPSVADLLARPAWSGYAGILERGNVSLERLLQ